MPGCGPQQRVMEIPSQIDLRIGESYTLRLKGIAGAGDSWSCRINGGEDIVRVFASTSTPPRTDSGGPPSGSSVEELFHFEALAPGHADVRLTQRRRPDQKQTALQGHTIRVNVTANAA